MSATLNDALADLKTRISTGYVDGVVEEVAAYYAVNPALLARKFKESTGVAPCDFKKVAIGAVMAQRAQDVARAARWRYRGGIEICGKQFKLGERTYVAVAMITDGIVAIRVDTCEEWLITYHTAEARNSAALAL